MYETDRPASWQRWKNIMKAYPFEERRLAKWQPPWIVQPKYDGVRCRAVRSGDSWILLSSEENVIFSVPHINESLNKAKELPQELDGELYCHRMSFEEIYSITSRTINLHFNHQDIELHLFDIINEEPQVKRTTQLAKLQVPKHVVISPFFVCSTFDGLMRTYDRIIELGYEGIIVRHCDAPYVRKRSTFVMKFKPKQEDTYEIIGSVEEVSKEGNPKERLGALVCKSGDGNIFNVGTGFSDHDRESLWSVKELLPGAKANVKYQHITPGRAVPRFPVFTKIEWRT